MPEFDPDFDGFILEKKIGKGGMAWVFLAKHKRLKRHVAIKIPFPEYAEEPHFVARFEREARTAAMMNHENVGLVHDFDWFQGTPFIVLEYVDGMDLGKWIEHHGSLPVEVALLVLNDVAKGLEHAHAPGRDVIHRDLKPSNIMLSKEGRVKLLDFGLARALSEDIVKTRTEGRAAGTVPYMSPEQAAGRFPDGEPGKLSDIFSLGIVFYEVLGGRRPFVGEHVTEIMRAIQTVEPPELSGLNPLVPLDAAELVRRMLRKAPQHRVQSMREVRDVLTRVLEHGQMKGDRDLIAEYVKDPIGSSKELRRKSVERHMQRGLHFKTLGHAGLEDALLEFRQVAYLDPANRVALRHVEELESETRRREARERKNDETVPEVSKVLQPLAEQNELGLARRADSRGARRGWFFAAAAAILALAAVFSVWRSGKSPSPEPKSLQSASEPTASSSGARLNTAPATGSLRVEVRPHSATLAIDGGAPGQQHRFEGITPGPHRFRAEAVGFKVREFQAVVPSGRETTVSVQLVAEPASTSAILASGAQQPSPKMARLPKATAATTRLRPDTAAVEPSTAGSSAIPAKGSAFGCLKVISTTDYFGDVWIDGRPTGRQTATLIRVPSGVHRVHLVHRGFRTLEGDQSVSVDAGETLAVRFAVVRNP